MSEDSCFFYFLISGISIINISSFLDLSIIHISSLPFYFRMIPASYFGTFPYCKFRHFCFISGLFHRLMSGNFRHSYFIISVSFPDYSVVLFPEISVIHISSFPFHFRIIPSSYFRKFPSFIFHHFRFISRRCRRLISGNFRHSYFIISVSFPDYSVLAVRIFFDLGLFSLETETHQYVLLGILLFILYIYILIIYRYISINHFFLFLLYLLRNIVSENILDLFIYCI